MGLLDKLKDLFVDDITEDADIELEEENKDLYEEPKGVLPKVMRETIKKEEEETIKLDELKPLKEETKKREDLHNNKIENEKKFSFPIDFEEEVTLSRVANRNILNVEKEPSKKPVELYPKKEVVQEKTKFKPTPVISPVYGILDKNYKKEEVREKAEENVEMRRPSKKVDFETVRKKAFGNLSDDIKDNLMCENCELYKEAKKSGILNSDNLLYDMMVDDTDKEIDNEVTLEKAIDNYEDYGVAYEPKKDVSINVENTTIINNNNTDVSIGEEIEIKDIQDEKNNVDSLSETKNIPSRTEMKKDEKVDDDFFKLIDSMYKERIDD